MPLDPDDVVAAANGWLWYPPDARVVETAEVLLVEWPDHFAVAPDLMRFTPAGDLEEAFATAVGIVRGWGHPSVTAWVKLDAPEGFEDLLGASGRLQETLDVFALDLHDGPLPAPDASVEVRWRGTLETSRDTVAVGIAAFGEGRMPDDETLARLGAEADAERRAGLGGGVVAYLEGRAVGAAGLTMAGTVARLWGGGVVPDARGRGVYRAMLAARLEYAVAHGATTALVKGRVETSGPILRRLGFDVFGQERSYVVPV